MFAPEAGLFAAHALATINSDCSSHLKPADTVHIYTPEVGADEADGPDEADEADAPVGADEADAHEDVSDDDVREVPAWLELEHEEDAQVQAPEAEADADDKDETEDEPEPEDDEADQVTTEIDLRSAERPPAPE